ncbi:MAG: hypothetical protein WDN06_16915 [Asticcacaulis sp.]
MGLLRLHAADYGIDSRRVGVLGFSAGGHMVADISTHFAKRAYAPVDAADALPCRPRLRCRPLSRPHLRRRISRRPRQPRHHRQYHRRHAADLPAAERGRSSRSDREFTDLFRGLEGKERAGRIPHLPPRRPTPSASARRRNRRPTGRIWSKRGCARSA